MKTVPRVVATLVTHNRPDDLRAAVAALRSQSVPLSAILVLDNASEVPAASILEEEDVIVIRSEENLGGAAGFARALQEALTLFPDWIWIMDDDAVPATDALERLLAPGFHEDPRVGALCSAVYEQEKLALVHRRSYNRWLAMEKPIPAQCYSTPACDIETGSFVGFLARAATVAAIGAPDASFFIAYDDTEYSLRIRRAGQRILLVPDSRIDHFRKPEARMRRNPFGLRHYYNIRNRIVVASRHCAWPALGRLSALIQGMAIWLSSQRPMRSSSLAFFGRAVRDGLAMCRNGRHIPPTII